jgi:hypothetical protein
MGGSLMFQTAFQVNAFQNNAFQINIIPPTPSGMDTHDGFTREEISVTQNSKLTMKDAENYGAVRLTLNLLLKHNKRKEISYNQNKKLLLIHRHS